MYFRNKLEFAPGKPIQPSLMFAGKARAFPSKAPFRYSTLGQAPGLIHKHQTRLERLAKDKHFSLLRKSVNYSRKKFYSTSTWDLYYKTFYGSNCCHIVINQSVCHFLSLSSWPNIRGQDQEPTISAESSMGLYSGMIEPYPQILEKGGSDRKWQTLQLITILLP